MSIEGGGAGEEAGVSDGRDGASGTSLAPPAVRGAEGRQPLPGDMGRSEWRILSSSPSSPSASGWKRLWGWRRRAGGAAAGTGFVGGRDGAQY